MGHPLEDNPVPPAAPAGPSPGLLGLHPLVHLHVPPQLHSREVDPIVRIRQELHTERGQENTGQERSAEGKLGWGETGQRAGQPGERLSCSHGGQGSHPPQERSLCPKLHTRLRLQARGCRAGQHEGRSDRRPWPRHARPSSPLRRLCVRLRPRATVPGGAPEQAALQGPSGCYKAPPL